MHDHQTTRVSDSSTLYRLPKVMRHRDRILKPFVQQFRSYILCEYGDHTTSENSNTQFEIHLVKHEGYDLDKPTEFFEKYGPYVLTQMYMDKYVTMATGSIAPTLRLRNTSSASRTLNHWSTTPSTFFNLSRRTTSMTWRRVLIRWNSTIWRFRRSGIDTTGVLSKDQG